MYSDYVKKMNHGGAPISLFAPGAKLSSYATAYMYVKYYPFSLNNFRVTFLIWHAPPC